MTTHSPSRRLAVPFVLTFAVAGLLAAGCTGIASPKGWASPVLTDDLVLVSHRETLFAFDAASLDDDWIFPSELTGTDDIDPDALYGTPAVANDTVFVPTYDDTLYALDAATGELRWPPFVVDGPLIGGVVVAQDTVYFGSSDGKIYALDTESGSLRWLPFDTGGEVWSTPAVSNEKLYVTSLAGNLYVLDAATGGELWSFSTDAGIASPPVVNEAAGLVYIAGLDSKLRAIDLETHEQRWVVEADNWFWTRPLLADGTVYAGGLDGKVYAVDAITGDPRWPQPFETEGPVRSAPVIVGGVLIVVDRDGKVYGIDAESGRAAFALPLVLEDDVLADPLVWTEVGPEKRELVLVVTTGGDLVQIDPATLQLAEPRRPLGD